jgi:hypothetical protein
VHELLAEQDTRYSRLEEKFQQVNKKVEQVDKKVDQNKIDTDKKVNAVNGRVDKMQTSLNYHREQQEQKMKTIKEEINVDTKRQIQKSEEGLNKKLREQGDKFDEEVRKMQSGDLLFQERWDRGEMIEVRRRFKSRMLAEQKRISTVVQKKIREFCEEVHRAPPADFAVEDIERFEAAHFEWAEKETNAIMAKLSKECFEELDRIGQEGKETEELLRITKERAKKVD